MEVVLVQPLTNWKKQIFNTIKNNEQINLYEVTGIKQFQEILRKELWDQVSIAVINATDLDTLQRENPEFELNEYHVLFLAYYNSLAEMAHLVENSQIDNVEYYPSESIELLPKILESKLIYSQKLRRRIKLDRFKIIVQTMPVLVDAFDENGNIVYWNNECERVTGYKAKEVISNPKALEILYPDEEYRNWLFAEWAKRGDNFRNWPIKLKARDGTERIISWSNLSDLYSIPGWRSWAIGIDITAQYRAEKELKEKTFWLNVMDEVDRVLFSRPNSEQVCASVLEKIGSFIPFKGALILMYDRERQLAEVITARFDKQLIYRSEEKIPLQNLLKYDRVKRGEIAVVDDLEEYAKKARIASLFLRHGLKTAIIFPLKHNNRVIGSLSLYFGEKYTFTEEEQSLLTKIADKLSLVLFQNRIVEQLQNKIIELENQSLKQMSELKKNETRLRTQYENLPIPTYTWQKSGDDFILIDYNDMAMAATYGQINEYLGHKASEVYRDIPELVDLIKECYENEISVETQIEVAHDENHPGFLLVKLAYAPPDSVLMHVEDVTEQIINKKRIEKLNELLIRQTQTIDSLHDDLHLVKDHLLPLFREQCNVLDELVKKISDEKKASEKVLSRSLKLFNDKRNKFNALLDLYEEYFKLEKRAVEMHEFDLDAVVQFVWDRYKEELEKANAQLHLYLEAKNFKNDKQMIIKLLSLLIEFSILRREESRPLLIRIVTSQDESVQFIYKDNGIGLTTKELRVVNNQIPLTSSQLSLGLDKLIIVKKIVDLLGGELELTSIENEGISFKMEFPV